MNLTKIDSKVALYQNIYAGIIDMQVIVFSFPWDIPDQTVKEDLYFKLNAVKEYLVNLRKEELSK